MLASLRQELARRALPAGSVVLPGDEGNRLEGALTLRQLPGGSWSLDTVDYGEAAPLGEAPDEQAAAELLLAYVDRPVPEPRRVDATEVDRLTATAAPHMQDLLDRSRSGALTIELPADVALDRIGALDGVFAFPYGTSFEARSLPPLDTQPDPRRHAFVTRRDVLVRVDVVQPWFGRPGGGLRCRIAKDFVGFRDLVIDGTLERITTD